MATNQVNLMGMLVGSTITLFEHEVTSGFGWTDRDLVALDRMRRLHGMEILRPTIRAASRELQATQHVGVFRFRDRTIQILPKIYRAETHDEHLRVREATKNLLHLLEIAGDLPIREQGIAPLLRRDMDWFEILTRLFATHLREEWQRGATRGYQRFEDDLPTLKGKWRVADQICRPGRDHLLAVAYDEFTTDIPLNRVFRFVVERLWSITRNSDNRQILGELRQWLDEVTLLPTMPASAANPSLLSRLNRRLEPLLNLARVFLDDGTMQMATGDLSAFAFVFDMNRVFEGFLVNFIRRHRKEILPPELWYCDLLPQTRNASRCLARTEGKGVFWLKPDLAIKNGPNFPLLMDAKYKRLASNESDVDVVQGDFYQMFAYARRYDCPRVVMLYPQTTDMLNSLFCEFALENSNGTFVTVATVDIRVNLGQAEGRKQLIARLKELFQYKEIPS
jgi:5-methylcytosine-specific restriction enzyme subunit McrC